MGWFERKEKRLEDEAKMARREADIAELKNLEKRIAELNMWMGAGNSTVEDRVLLPELEKTRKGLMNKLGISKDKSDTAGAA